MRRPSLTLIPLTLVALSVLSAGTLAAETPDAPSPYVPDLADLRTPPSELRELTERFLWDRWALTRRHDGPSSAAVREVLRGFYHGWDEALDAVDFDALGVEGRIDWLLLENRVAYELRQLDHEERAAAETAPLLPFAGAVVDLHEARRRMEDVDPRAAAEALVALAEAIESTREAVERGLAPKDEAPKDEAPKDDDAGERLETTRTLAHRAAQGVDGLRETLDEWYGFYDGYDPLFTWWVKEPHKAADDALSGYADFLRKRVVGVREGEDPPIVGNPVGRDRLMDDLALAMIPYTPEELLEIGRREFAWCEAELDKAAAEMGLDRAAAVERVKTLHVEPGRQPALVRDLAREAVAFLEERDLVTIPELAKDVWRMTMLSPERQKVSPFFLGGEVVQVSFPTDAMAHDDKLMSMRGNNVHFARATVHHELIPGHHLQGFMTERYHPHREHLAGSPFWYEGNALYWEMRLWDLGFPRSPEDKVGMLFWRIHRAARILFSLGFHLGEMTPEEAVDLLVTKVGHERANAEAEVRRSFEGRYPPLYQLAYMIGGLQFMALHQELVVNGEMSERVFHDAILRGGPIPVELVRARLKGEALPRDTRARWRFADPPDGGR